MEVEVLKAGRLGRPKRAKAVFGREIKVLLRTSGVFCYFWPDYFRPSSFFCFYFWVSSANPIQGAAEACALDSSGFRKDAYSKGK